MNDFKVTVREANFTDPETTAYEGKSIWAAISTIHHFLGKQNENILLLYVNEKPCIDAHWSNVEPKVVIGVSGNRSFDVLSALLTPPTEDEKKLTESFKDVAIGIIEATGLFGKVKHRQDNRDNELVFGLKYEDGETLEFASMHFMSSMLVDMKLKDKTDDFTLNAEQMAFMKEWNAAAETAYDTDDDQFFDVIVASDEWKLLFGTMSWDEAYDRYELTEDKTE